MGQMKPAKEGRKKVAEEEKAEGGKRLAAGDVVGVRAALGRVATVFGKVTRVSVSARAHMTFIELDGGKFTLVCRESDYGKFPNKEPGAEWLDKMVEVTGEVSEYTKREPATLQMKLKEATQLRSPLDTKPDKPEAGRGKQELKKPAVAPEKKDGEPRAPGARVDARKYFK